CATHSREVQPFGMRYDASQHGNQQEQVSNHLQPHSPQGFGYGCLHPLALLRLRLQPDLTIVGAVTYAGQREPCKYSIIPTNVFIMRKTRAYGCSRPPIASPASSCPPTM